MGGYVLSAMFICWEYAHLGKRLKVSPYLPHHPIANTLLLRRSSSTYYQDLILHKAGFYRNRDSTFYFIQRLQS